MIHPYDVDPFAKLATTHPTQASVLARCFVCAEDEDQLAACMRLARRLDALGAGDFLGGSAFLGFTHEGLFLDPVAYSRAREHAWSFLERWIAP